MHILLVDYAQLYSAAKELGVVDPLEIVAKYVLSHAVDTTYFWAYSVGGKRFLSEALEARGQRRDDFKKVECSEIPLESITDFKSRNMSGSMSIGGAAHKLNLRIPEQDSTVDFSVRISYAAGVISTTDSSVDRISVISNSPELIPCLADIGESDIAVKIAFLFPQISSRFYRAISTHGGNIKLTDLTSCIAKSSIRGSSIYDRVFSRM